MQTLILSLHVIVCVTLVILVLLQAGKEGMGVIFGGGNASVFGSSGAGGLLAKMTAFMAVLFIVTSLSYNYVSSSHKAQESTILDVRLEDTPKPAAPAATVPATPAEKPAEAPAADKPANYAPSKVYFRGHEQFMASFFIRARPQSLPPFLLDFAKKQSHDTCPRHSFPRPFKCSGTLSVCMGKPPHLPHNVF